MSAAAASVVALPKRPLDQSLYAEGARYKLYRGDSLELLPLLPPRSVDLIFADPPYFLSNGGFTCKSGRRAKVDKGDWDASAGVSADHQFTTDWLAACQRVLKPSGTIWVSGTQHVIFSVGFAMQSLGYKLLNTVTWYKPNASPNLSCRYFTHSTELLIWAAPHPVRPLPHTFAYRAMKEANGGKQMRDVWALPRPSEEELADDGEGRIWTIPTPGKTERSAGRHPTQKPLALLRRVVEASCPEGGLVLDPFNGSGTTGAAAVELGRRYIGMDREEVYLERTQARLDQV